MISPSCKLNITIVNQMISKEKKRTHFIKRVASVICIIYIYVYLNLSRKGYLSVYSP